MSMESLSRRNTVRTQIKGLSPKSKLAVDITLNDDQHDAYVSSYATLDSIEGEVSITAPSDTRFDDILITFEGSTKTYVEKIASTAPTNGRTQAYHNFLRLTQPINDASFPQPRIAEAGRTYRFPFHFVVPERLLPQSCTHSRENEQVHDVHLQLPPSLGDPMLASDGRSLMDDMAPDMSTISYAIKVRAVQNRERDGKHIILADSAKKLRIIPATEERPPLTVTDSVDEDYIFRKEKDLKKGMFKGKLGRLTMEAAQPKALQLPAPRSESTCSPTTMATVTLRFDPADESAQPPRLGQLWNKLKVATFFGTLPMRNFPTKASVGNYDSQRGLFVETLNLSSRCVESAQWEQHTSSSHPTPIRRDSTFSISSATSIPKPSSAYAGTIFYTAKILVPITLPTNRTFTPTFHSCLISRIYALDFSLSMHTGTSVSAPTMHLKVPLQISSAGNPLARPEISAAEAEAIAGREADDFFNPRSVAPPSPEYTERAEPVQRSSQSMMQVMSSAAPPPGYSFFARPGHGMSMSMTSRVGVSSACG
ncbi:MAG: hypothetical protein M1830_008203 [Pleopsidium flavum]|nr:MAG: hypothetical protein M1830_008203 [Pleopsidium flavum]